MKKEEIILYKIIGGDEYRKEDVVAAEQILEVFVDDCPGFTVSCTPENLQEFFTGHLFLRGLIKDAAQLRDLQVDLQKGKVFAVRNRAVQEKGCAAEKDRNAAPRGVLGKGSLRKMLCLAEQVFEHPGPLFLETGCAHCCALAYGDKIFCCFEDIGRHNALDKAVGFALRQGIPLEETAVYTSGRISADYVKKLAHAGIPTVISRAAVTGEAVRLARENQIQMLGFVRKGNANVYSPFSEKESTFFL